MTKSILLPGEPVAQKRARIFAKGAMDPCWEAKQQHQHYIRENYKDLEYFTEPVYLNLVFSYAFTKSMPKKKRMSHFKESRPDLDNLVKYIMDMGNGLFWEDDSVVANLTATKLYNDQSFTLVRIGRLSNKDLFPPLALIGVSK